MRLVLILFNLRVIRFAPGRNIGESKKKANNQIYGMSTTKAEAPK
jgi:hypothetical protein